MAFDPWMLGAGLPPAFGERRVASVSGGIALHSRITEPPRPQLEELQVMLDAVAEAVVVAFVVVGLNFAVADGSSSLFARFEREGC